MAISGSFHSSKLVDPFKIGASKARRGLLSGYEGMFCETFRVKKNESIMPGELSLPGKRGS
jgi:hypothetical protein